MIIGTRGSQLALAQAETVARLLKAKGVETSLKIIKTSGDRFTDRPLHAVSSGVGAFVRELDEVMLEGKIDIAVHSMKDMPTIRPPTLPTVAVLKRDTPFDLLLTYDGTPLDELSEQSIIGTSSLRRAAQIKRYRPDLVTQDLRGNIDTRLRKLKEGKYDGILLAKAGLERMGWELEGEILSPDFFCPSPNQGTIAVVTRAETEAEAAVSRLDHTDSRIATEIERILISELGGGCTTPIGSYAEIMPDRKKLHVRAEVLSLDGEETVGINEFIPMAGGIEKARELGSSLVHMGGKKLADEALMQLSRDSCDSNDLHE
ncbi:Porphobilinogen deaminase [Methanosarcina barkeri str. Wiesmoor]|uniref:Probable porphobilinogen deaminase n=2 Tax=Methanosarcina barkeri TaxID=2208 RepID=HEM3_METBF|nr:hydroxymethylbilane synthase [Methanosarcina barkeri]Q46CH0.1 RecName: Full=Probable porphobilinogen deaminase; Short=PBG; AltName: Full=Hydroxymethylbilane synthase; Short=HMBS; AltName: Full=Pre-uroporphyrinogen synthase [Methanosarcina barkeri str. Fusaro]AKB52515.1 Porphobilinogen deaminase [Methanosarcina barkeri str. Wiesmoor]